MGLRKSAVCFVALGLAGILSAATVGTAKAQRPHVQHRETNASRQARIQRTIEDTYSHRWEVFGGGGMLRFRNGETLKDSNQVTWATSVNYFLNTKLYVTGHASGAFGYANIINSPYNIPKAQINEYFFMGGAGYRFYGTEKVAVSADATGGTAWGIFSGGAKGHAGTDLGIWQDGIRPAFSVGVNLDYNIYPNLAFRITPTYVGTTFNSVTNVTNPLTGVIVSSTTSSAFQNNVGFNAGILYRFGRH
jgi:hypothetical protein